MRSAFFGFHVASSALFTSRANLNVISHNIANAEIPGFSRQVAQARANDPLSLRDGRGMYGTGSRVTGVVQMRNHFLDVKFWGQRAVMGQHTAVNTHLTFTETVFNNLGGVGVLQSFTGFFERLQDLTANADDATFRTNVVTQSGTLADMVRHHAETLHRQQRDVNREVADTVSTINSLGAQISRLNNQIHIFERTGENANDLRDQRALLIDQLSELVNVQVIERDFSTPQTPNDRRMIIMVNGYDFVHHSDITRMELVPRTEAERRNEMDVPGLYDIVWEGSGSPFNIHSTNLQGTLRGLIDVRDGNHTVVTENEVVRMRPPGFDPYNPTAWVGAWPPGMDASTFRTGEPATWPVGTVIGPGDTSRFKGIPFYMNQLNHLVRTFASAMNEGRNANGERIPARNATGELVGGYTVGHIFGYDGNGVNRETMLFTFTNNLGQTENVNSLRMWLLDDGTRVSAQDFPEPPANVMLDESDNAMFVLDYSRMNALNFKLNPALDDPMLLVTSSNSNIGQANNDVIHGFIGIGHDRSLFREGRLEDFIIATSTHLAVDKQQAEMFQVSFEEITTVTHNHRLSIKGVSIDEEMMNLVRFQTMFTAASRLVNVMDSVYETLINRLGNVGR